MLGSMDDSHRQLQRLGRFSSTASRDISSGGNSSADVSSELTESER